jgi:hypothetical protein
MQASEQRVRAALPIRSTARNVNLMVEEASGRWHSAASFALGSGVWDHPGARAGQDGERMPGSTTESPRLGGPA